MMASRRPNQYDLTIIGGGAAGLTAVTAALQLGATVALVEGQHLGGECTWTGCIPSKTLIATARTLHRAKLASRMGIHVHDVTVDFAAVMRHVHTTIEEVYAEETPAIIRKQGATVYEQYGQFIDAHTLQLTDGTYITSKHFLICTGATPIIPQGFAHVPYLTAETLFALQTCPQHLVIVGAGHMGVEMAQTFRRLGSAVTLIGRSQQILAHVDAQAAAQLTRVLQDEGITIRLGVSADRAEQVGEAVTVYLSDGSQVTGDRLLLAVGKRPNLASLNLAAAKVSVQAGKLVLDDRLRTTQAHIWAAGDVSGGAQYTHYAGWQAFQAVRNALLPLTSIGVKTHVPFTTFTDPEVAQVGLTEAQARALHGATVHVTQLPFSRADRAMTEGQGEGYMKLLHLPNGRLIGANIVGYNAGEMINDWIAILDKGGRVWDAASPMRVYPTLGTGNVILATEQVKTQLATGLLGRLIRAVSGFTVGRRGSA